MSKGIIAAIAGISILTALLIGVAAGTYFNNEHNKKEHFNTLKEKVKNEFIDPDSVIFRNLRMTSPQIPIPERLTNLLDYVANGKIDELLSYDPNYFLLCGEVNAKNRLGGYVGYKKFTVEYRDNQVDFDQNDKIIESECRIGFEVYSEE